MKLVTYQQAKDNKLPRYFSGKACPHGHTAQRMTKTRKCCACLHAERTAKAAARKIATAKWNAVRDAQVAQVQPLNEAMWARIDALIVASHKLRQPKQMEVA